MTGSNDLDRQLAAYLDDGPRRAPDRAVDAAIAFAVAHPRRPDPLRFLRPDVMPRRTSMFGPQLVYAALLVALTLGAIAVIAIGTQPTRQPVVPPPSAVESPSPSAEPPSPSPAPTPFELELTDASNAITWPVTVTDASGTLVSVQPEDQLDAPPVDRIDASNDPADPSRVLLVWTFCGAPETQALTIDETATAWRLERPVCGDTLGGADLRMTLTFSQPVDASAIELELIESPRGE